MTVKVDIYISERSGSRKIRIPWLPEEIDFKIGEVAFASYDIMNKGEVAVPTGAGLATISWAGEFPGQYRTDSAMLRGSWKAPKTYHNIMESWKKNGTALRVMVTGYPINKDVYLEEYTCTATGGFGDLAYEVSFLEDRDITISTTKVKTSTTKRSTKKTTTYTIKKGDTLWAIAKKYLGAGSKWKTIYNANKSIIEQTAKKHGKKSSNQGWWIWPGTKITIP